MPIVPSIIIAWTTLPITTVAVRLAWIRRQTRGLSPSRVRTAATAAAATDGPPAAHAADGKARPPALRYFVNDAKPVPFIDRGNGGRLSR